MKVLNFGSLNIDHVYDVVDFPKPGETIDSLKYDTFLGGKGLNQSIALQRCGTQVYHAGMVGEDGKILVETLANCGVDTSHIDICKCKTGHALIQVNGQGENCIILYHGANKLIQKEDIDRVLKDFNKDDVIILQNEISNIDYLIEVAYKKDMVIVFNPAPYTKDINDFTLAFVTYMILNETEAKGLTGCEDIDKAKEMLQKAYPDTSFVITLGSDGSYFFGKGKTIYQKAFTVPVTDTTGAGDTFIGYFIGNVIAHCSIAESLERAAKAAAIAITKKGASNAIPYLEEVLSSELH